MRRRQRARAAQTTATLRAAQACAALSGEDFVRTEHVQKVAVAVLAHRVLPRAEVRSRGGSVESVIARLIEEVDAVPLK